MKMEDLIKKYDELYNNMAMSKDVKRMRAFGEAEMWAYHQVAEHHPEVAKEWLERIKSNMWNNYLSEEQARELAAKIVNQDGSMGPKWTMDMFTTAVIKLGGKMEDEPYYNRWALWLVANAHYSDFAKSTAEDMGYRSVIDVPSERMALSMYRKAVESLKDIDRPHYIKNYYHV